MGSFSHKSKIETPLIAALKTDNIERAKLLLGYKDIDVNMENMSGETPLIIAINRESFDMVRLLYTSRVRLNLKGNAGQTPLFAATRKDNVEIVKLLIEKGVPLAHKNNVGKTALEINISDEVRKNIDLLKAMASFQGLEVLTEKTSSLL